MKKHLTCLIVLLLVFGLVVDPATAEVFTSPPVHPPFTLSLPIGFESQAIVPWLWRFLTPLGRKQAAKLDRQYHSLKYIRFLGSGGFNMGHLVRMPDGQKATLLIAGNEKWLPEMLPIAKSNLAQLAQTMRDLNASKWTGKLLKVFEDHSVMADNNEGDSIVNAIARTYFEDPTLLQAVQRNLLTYQEAKRQILEISDDYEKSGYAIYDGEPNNFYYNDGHLWHSDLGLTQRVEQMQEDGRDVYEEVEGKMRHGNLNELFTTIQSLISISGPSHEVYGVHWIWLRNWMRREIFAKVKGLFVQDSVDKERLMRILNSVRELLPTYGWANQIFDPKSRLVWVGNTIRIIGAEDKSFDCGKGALVLARELRKNGIKAKIFNGITLGRMTEIFVRAGGHTLTVIPDRIAIDDPLLNKIGKPRSDEQVESNFSQGVIIGASGMKVSSGVSRPLCIVDSKIQTESFLLLGDIYVNQKFVILEFESKSLRIDNNLLPAGKVVIPRKSWTAVRQKALQQNAHEFYFSLQNSDYVDDAQLPDEIKPVLMDLVHTIVEKLDVPFDAACPEAAGKWEERWMPPIIHMAKGVPDYEWRYDDDIRMMAKNPSPREKRDGARASDGNSGSLQKPKPDEVVKAENAAQDLRDLNRRLYIALKSGAPIDKGQIIQQLRDLREGVSVLPFPRDSRRNDRGILLNAIEILKRQGSPITPQETAKATRADEGFTDQLITAEDLLSEDKIAATLAVLIGAMNGQMQKSDVIRKARRSSMGGMGLPVLPAYNGFGELIVDPLPEGSRMFVDVDGVTWILQQETYMGFHIQGKARSQPIPMWKRYRDPDAAIRSRDHILDSEMNRNLKIIANLAELEAGGETVDELKAKAAHILQAIAKGQVRGKAHARIDLGPALAALASDPPNIAPAQSLIKTAIEPLSEESRKIDRIRKSIENQMPQLQALKSDRALFVQDLLDCIDKVPPVIEQEIIRWLHLRDQLELPAYHGLPRGPIMRRDQLDETLNRMNEAALAHVAFLMTREVGTHFIEASNKILEAQRKLQTEAPDLELVDKVLQYSVDLLTSKGININTFAYNLNETADFWDSVFGGKNMANSLRRAAEKLKPREEKFFLESSPTRRQKAARILIGAAWGIAKSRKLNDIRASLRRALGWLNPQDMVYLDRVLARIDSEESLPHQFLFSNLKSRAAQEKPSPALVAAVKPSLDTIHDLLHLLFNEPALQRTPIGPLKDELKRAA